VSITLFRVKLVNVVFKKFISAVVRFAKIVKLWASIDKKLSASEV